MSDGDTHSTVRRRGKAIALLLAGLAIALLAGTCAKQADPPSEPAIEPQTPSTDAATVKEPVSPTTPSLGMLSNAAAGMLSSTRTAKAGRETPATPSATTQAVSAVDLEIARYVASYTHPSAMMSAGPPRPPMETNLPPATPSELITQAYINHTMMVSPSPQNFSQGWIAYRSRYDEPEEESAAKAPEPEAPSVAAATNRALLPANPENITRAMYLVREAEGRRREGDLDGAIALYEQALERFPQMHLANREAGRLHLMRGRYQEAILRLKAALQGSEQRGAIYGDLGSAYLYAGKSELALESFESGLKAEPDNADLQFNRALALRRIGRTDESRTALDAYLLAYPSDARGYREMAMTDLAATNHTSALAGLEKASSLDPAWYLPRIDIALIHAQEGNAMLALTELERALDLAPAWLIGRVYQQPAFRDIRLMPESKTFESNLVARLRTAR